MKGFRNNGMTLMELLVVIAIIAILSSIILPAIGASRAKGRQTVCANQFRQMGMAILLYSEHWQGSLPGPCRRGIIDPQITPTPENDMALRIKAFTFGKERFWECPQNKDLPQSLTYLLNSTSETGVSFGLSYYFGNPDGDQGDPANRPKKMLAINSLQGSLGEQWAVCDIDYVNYSYNNILQNAVPSPVHSNGRNYLFFDGHVKWFGTVNFPEPQTGTEQ